MGLPLKNLVKIKASPLKNSNFFHSSATKIPNFYNLPLENSWPLVLTQGGTDIKLMQ